MAGVSLRRAIAVSASLVAATLWANALPAQSAVFTGRVTSEAQQPLAGANVAIPELGVGTITSTDGRYTFTVDAARARGQPVNVVVRYIGYKPKRLRITVTPGRTEHDFVLERDVLQLEQVVVTGTGTALEQRKTTFAVGVVDNTQIKEVPATSPIGALEGKVAGASIVTQTGQPGAEPAIRLRSATSITGRQDPLIIIDGTIATLGLADINSEDIDRVEVIKGAAASSLYGSNAANGVIQIFTKRGANLAEGQTAFTVRTEYGRNDLSRKIGSNMHHNYQLNPDGSYRRNANGDRQDEPDKIVDNRYPVYYDQLGLVFDPGDFMTNYVSVGHRRGNTNLNASFQNTDEAGVLTMLNGFQRQNFRVNADQALTDKIDLGFGAFYGRSHSDQGETSFPWFGMRFLEPDMKIDSLLADGTYNPAINQPPLSGNVSNPLYVLQQHKESQIRDRFTGTFRGVYRALSWLSADANIGYDQATQNYKSFFPLGYTSSGGSTSKGSLEQEIRNNRAYNIGASLTSIRTLWSVRNTTRAAFVYEDQINNILEVTAPALAVPKVAEFEAAAQDPNNPVQPGSRTEEIRARNVFVISTFDIKDRYIIDGLVRRDESSLFGADERTAIYHRLSGAYRVTEDFRIPGVDELKLRVSHGTAGLRPLFEAQYEVFDVVSGQPQKVTLGNKQLKPAFSRETEYGVNVSFLQNYSFEYSYSRKRTTDQIMQVPLSAATGYQNQWRNAGTLDGNSHEIALGAVLLSKADYFWRLNVTADRTRAKITDLNVPAFFVGPDLNTKMFRIATGEQLGVIYGDKWIQTQAELEETIRAGRLTGTVDDYQLNEEGFYVAKTQYHTINETPLKAWKCSDAACTTASLTQKIGDVNPDFNLGLSSVAQWKAFSLSGVVTWVRGGNIYNLTRQWPFNELRDAAYDQSGRPDPGTCPALTVDPQCPYTTGKKPSTYYSAFYNGITPNSYFVEDGSYVRLRELSVSWMLPQRLAAKIPGAEFRTARLGVVGRNLWTSTNYSGYNPDVTTVVNGQRDNPFVYRVDYFTYPAFRTFSAMIELGF
jgi:TonB-linked SusC/RagA family outer membrane protein